MRLRGASYGLVCLALALSGCQSWSQMTQNMPSAARVPPPGTGTYQVPSSYYSNQGAKTNATTSTATGAAAVRAASATSPTSSTPNNVSTAVWQQPSVNQYVNSTNNTATAALNNLGTQANQTIQSGAAQASSAIQKSTDAINNWANGALPPGSVPPNSAAKGSLSDGGMAPQPSLNWQPPQ